MTTHLFQWFKDLSWRERKVLKIGLGVVGLALVYAFLLDPFTKRLHSLDQLIDLKERQVQDLAHMAQDYGQIQKRLQTLNLRLPNTHTGERAFSLIAHLQNLAGATGVEQHLTSIQPQSSSPISHTYREEAVQLRLERLTFAQIVRFVARIEQSPYLLRIKQLTLNPYFDQPQELEATLVVVTYEKA